jgi:hypothetical protein
MKPTFTKFAKTIKAEIYCSGGDHNNILNLCQEFCLDECLCVSCEKIDYVFKGGREKGTKVILLNYPRFPVTKEIQMEDTARKLAEFILEKTFQRSILIVRKDVTEWICLVDQEKSNTE